MPLFDGASSTLHNLDLLSTSRVYSGLLHAFIADPHTPLYLIKSITHICVAKKKKKDPTPTPSKKRAYRPDMRACTMPDSPPRLT
jgi:hypothetical protein